MVTTDKLYKLISTLQSAEKRFFKMHVARQEGNSQQYMQLFQLMEKSIALDAQQEPFFTLDEEALMVRMKRKGVQEHQFHVIRYQLAQMLFKSLRLMQEEVNREDAIRVSLKNAEVLGRRGLFDWAGETAEESYEAAIKYEYHALALEALQLLVYFRSQGDGRHYAEKLQENLRDLEAEAALLEDEHRLFALSYRVLTLFRTTRSLKPEETGSEIAALSAHPLLETPPTAPTFMSQLYFHHTHATLAYLRSGIKVAMPLFARVVDLWENEAYRHIKAERPIQYIVHLSNYLNFCIMVGEFDTCERHLRALENFRPASSDDEAEIFQNLYFLQQLLLLNRGQPEEAAKLVPAIEKGLKKYAFKINKSRLFSIRYHIILTFFSLGQFEKALTHCDILLRYGKSEQRRDVQLFSNILRHISYLELGNFDALERFAVTTRNNLKRDVPAPDFERIALTHLAQLAEAYLKGHASSRLWRTTLQAPLVNFLKALEEYAATKPPRMPLGFEETVIWVKSKVSGRPFKDLMRGA